MSWCQAKTQSWGEVWVYSTSSTLWYMCASNSNQQSLLTVQTSVVQIYTHSWYALINKIWDKHHSTDKNHSLDISLLSSLGSGNSFSILFDQQNPFRCLWMKTQLFWEHIFIRWAFHKKSLVLSLELLWILCLKAQCTQETGYQFDKPYEFTTGNVKGQKRK